jgi:protein-tyrosine phosphatase
MQAQIVPILEAGDYAQEILRGAELLSSGRLVVLPTETVYGVAGVLTSAEARAGLAQMRGAGAKAFTVHVARAADALGFLGGVNDFAKRAMRKLWPGPIGLIFDVPEAKRRETAERLGVDEREIYDGAGTIILRCPDNPVFVDVVGSVKEPVVLTSPGSGVQSVADLPEEILSQVETIFDAGTTRFSKPSTLVRIRESSYEIARSGVYDERIIDRLLQTTILFICSGNTCRSPMAEGIARKYLAERLSVPPGELEAKGVTVISAGSYAMPGAKAAAPAVEVLQGMGVDLTRHRSRPLSVELIHQADAIFTMSQNHARAVVSLVPSAADKVSNLDPDGDIEDPIGGDVKLYAEVAERIKALIEKRLASGIVS